MAEMQVELAGVRFRNPIIISSCSLTTHLGKMKRLEEAGAGGLTTKLISRYPLPHRSNLRVAFHGSSWGVASDARVLLGDGLELIRSAKRELSIPIIANFAGRSADLEIWAQTAKDLEKAGADMVELDLNAHPEGDLELNVPPNVSLFDDSSVGQDPIVTGRLVKAVKEAVDIPVLAKLTLRAPDLVAVAQACKDNGAAGISALNSLRALPGVDITRGGRPIYLGMDTQGTSAVQGPELNSVSLKYTAILSKTVDLPLISAGGVMTWEHAVERLMLGARAVGLCSAIYMNGLQALSDCVTGLENYLDEYGYSGWDRVRGCALQYIVDLSDVVVRPLKARIADEQKCRECGAICVEKTAPECLALSTDGDGIRLDENACTGCCLCYWFCPKGAIEMMEQ